MCPPACPLSYRFVAILLMVLLAVVGLALDAGLQGEPLVAAPVPPRNSLTHSLTQFFVSRFLSCFWFRVQSDRVALHIITHHETKYVHQPRPRAGVCGRGGTGCRFVDNVFAMEIWLIYRNPNMRRVTGWVREVVSLRLFGLVILQLKTAKHFTTRLQHNVTQTRTK